MEVHSWRRGSPLGFGRVLTAIAVFGALADVTFQFTGSETIEFSPQDLKIQKNFFGWERTSQYPIEQCSELSWQPEEGRKSHNILEVKVGWRKVSFGKYLSQAQAWEILSELQRYLPDVAQKMGMFPEGRKSHLTSLGLS
jgi:hypothetical protein